MRSAGLTGAMLVYTHCHPLATAQAAEAAAVQQRIADGLAEVAGVVEASASPRDTSSQPTLAIAIVRASRHIAEFVDLRRSELSTDQ